MFCKKCGFQNPETNSFCISCGAPLAPAAAPAAAPQTDNTKAMSIVAYILFFVPMITGDWKKSDKVFFHVNQGFTLFLLNLVWSIVLSIVGGILGGLFLHSWSTIGIYSALSMALNLLRLVPFVLLILGIVGAAKGEQKPLPIIGSFTFLKK